MMTAESTQQKFFQHIKNVLPAHLSLVDEVAEVLNISTDSAYRRIRGEKPIDFEELKKLAAKYKISIDQFLLLDSNSILFSDRSLQSDISVDFSLYLKALVEDLNYIISFENRRLYYLSKDVPIYHHFTFPELAAFKCFFWLKSVNPDPAFAKEVFSLQKYMHQFSELTSKIFQLQLQVPTVEMWNVECINVTIRQIEYFRETKSFESKKEVVIIYEKLLQVVDQIELYAEWGEKRIPDKPHIKGAPYYAYINEVILGDNSILVELNENKIVYVNHGNYHYIMTRDKGFCQFTYNHFQNIIRRSTLISAVNEKDRKRFFNRIRERILKRLQTLP